jgi:(p)ppGpp synthase/HD superfamily hydrolase
MKEHLSKAIAFAAEKHVGQYDKGGIPYICHPLAVMISLNTEDQELMAIAVLHDVVEDCKVSYDQLWLTCGFTKRIIEGVRGMTKIDGETVNENLLRMMKNSDVVDVKIKDLNHNMQPSRLKGFTEKDCIRMNKYMYMYRILVMFKSHGVVESKDWKVEYGTLPDMAGFNSLWKTSPP